MNFWTNWLSFKTCYTNLFIKNVLGPLVGLFEHFMCFYSVCVSVCVCERARRTEEFSSHAPPSLRWNNMTSAWFISKSNPVFGLFNISTDALSSLMPRFQQQIFHLLTGSHCRYFTSPRLLLTDKLCPFRAPERTGSVLEVFKPIGTVKLFN